MIPRLFPGPRISLRQLPKASHRMSSKKHWLETRKVQKCLSSTEVPLLLLPTQQPEWCRAKKPREWAVQMTISSRDLGSVLAATLRSGRSREKGEASERVKNRPKPNACKGHSTSEDYFSVVSDPPHPLHARPVPQHARPASF